MSDQFLLAQFQLKMISLTENHYTNFRSALMPKQNNSLEIINQFSQSSSIQSSKFKSSPPYQCEDPMSRKFRKILMDQYKPSHRYSMQDHQNVYHRHSCASQQVKQNDLKGLIKEKDKVIYDLTEQIIGMTKKLNTEREKCRNLEQYVERLESIYCRQSGVRQQNLTELQMIERNMDVLTQKLHRTNNLNRKYIKEIEQLKQTVDNLSAAIRWSEQENYRFRIALRELKQKLGIVNNVKDSLFANKVLNKSQSSTKTQGSYAQGNYVQECTRRQWRSKFEIRNLSKKLFNIAQCLPLQNDQNLTLFEPECDQDLQNVVKIIEQFCSQYEQKMKQLDQQRKQQQTSVGQFLIYLVKQFKIDRRIINQYMQAQGKGKSVVQNINLYCKQHLNFDLI